MTGLRFALVLVTLGLVYVFSPEIVAFYLGAFR